ncbi:hypothetical protein QR685DRAFT_107547 [Neurospora intermedia]|uniref:Golgi apparatus membrane protein TVP23 homolog n=1 Tax=Neurospora intermedia TaxID=5142 RepID=A0ABR3D1R1_NEUIN
MALLEYSRLVGTTSSDSAFTTNDNNDTSSKSISTTSTTTASTTKPPTTTHPAPATTPTILNHIIPLLTTTFKTLYQTHLLLFSLCFSTLTLLLVHVLSNLHLFLLNLFLFVNFILYRTLFFIRTITMETATLSYSIWDSRKARQIRKKIEFEFFVWILGPGGNLLCFLLWPGWIVLGVMVWGLSWVFSSSGLARVAVSG